MFHLVAGLAPFSLVIYLKGRVLTWAFLREIKSVTMGLLLPLATSMSSLNCGEMNYLRKYQWKDLSFVAEIGDTF